ncbi:MAG: hypothetical protein AB8B97_27980 [Granulosicoccus sp.]
MNNQLLQRVCSDRLLCAGLCLVCCWPAMLMADNPVAVLDRLPTPAGATVQMVTSDSVHNGMPIAIATFNSAQANDSVISFYRDQWNNNDSDKPPGFVESALPDWQLISRVNQGFNIVVQLHSQAQDGAAGFISVMSINATATAEEHDEFADLKPLSSHRSVDGVDTSLMRVYASPSSVSLTHQRYRKRLVNRGWQIVSDSDIESHRVTVLARDQSRLELSIVASRDYGSVVVAHQVTSQ